MRKWLDRYYGVFRKIKLNYVLLNLLNYGKLKANRDKYRELGIKKPVWAPVSSLDFAGRPDDRPWLDQPDAIEQLQKHPDFHTFDEKTRNELLHWPNRGYMVLDSFFSEGDVDAINAEVDRLITQKEVDFNFTGRKIMFAFRHSDLLRDVAKDSRLHRLLSFVLGREVVPFQTINFLQGSEQRAHSDFIHMTTEPKGNLIAAWIALEDIHTDNGPLIYYPGSHKLPYILNGTYDHGGNRWMIGNDAYGRYEEEVQRMIDQHGLKPQEFHAKKGDVLIWHGNLYHAGKPILREGATRKSMVVHFFGEGVFCYHELTQRPAFIETV